MRRRILIAMGSRISKSPKDAQPDSFINSLASLYFVLTGTIYLYSLVLNGRKTKKPS